MGSLVCVDANIVVWSLIPSALSDRAEEFFVAARTRQLSLVAPALLSFEVSATLRRMVYLRAITPDEGEEAFEVFLRMPIRISRRSGAISLAWQLAKQLNRPRTYDTAYLAVGQIHGCDLWTADERLYNSVNSKLSWVKWLGDFTGTL